VHEAAGRQQALAEIAAQGPRRSGVVRTGTLALDLDTESVTVEGQAVSLTPIELQIVLYLGERVGTLCLAVDIVRAVWGEEQAQMELSTGSKTCHSLNVNISRIRAKIGDNRSLLETVKARGYLLHATSTS
jgi:DNA-binding response OmpR family regulator